MKNFVLLFFLLVFHCTYGQVSDKNIIQITGTVVTEEDGNPVPVPYANIQVKGTDRGVGADFYGYFSLPVIVGETLVFSAIGYKSHSWIVPDSFEVNRYTSFFILTKDSLSLPQAVIYPWPSKEHFKLEFLEIEIDDELLDNAMENLDREKLVKLREKTIRDGRETSNFYFKQQAQEYYYMGQLRPQNLFNVVSWKKFFDAWKNGDFKKKKKT